MVLERACTKEAVQIRVPYKRKCGSKLVDLPEDLALAPELRAMFNLHTIFRPPPPFYLKYLNLDRLMSYKSYSSINIEDPGVSVVERNRHMPSTSYSEFKEYKCTACSGNLTHFAHSLRIGPGYQLIPVLA